MKYIIPEKDLWDSLLRVNKPGRYIGGEYGIAVKNDKHLLHVALSYPDLYEIGMSNHAIKILYSLLNAIPGVYCERVFTPAPDFEEELKNKKMPLYSLETGRPLKEFDIICFSIGYELTATNILTILDRGGINIKLSDRDNNDPVIIAGGPAITNPLPFSSFIDCFFIGEAEGKIEHIFSTLAQLKRKGSSRLDLLEYLSKESSIWSISHPEHKADKNTWMDFSHVLSGPPFPVPNIKIVQDQGVVEIMRGCPNSCRFCHASIFYRPFRYKKPILICSEVEQIILQCGYRKIALSSLSSGDYKHLDILVKILSDRYHHAGVSFSLPSLRIDTFSLSLLQDISSVRKSGLTFAVETPKKEWQTQLNKNIDFEKTISLLVEAKKRGWRAAKFYFMIGLPLYSEDESDSIITYVKEIQKRTRMQLTVNISTFIPKSHTPFQWSSQLSEQEALNRIINIKKNLQGKNFKINYHSPFASFLEGIISRGDDTIGDVILRAYEKGARLDAWDDYIKKDIWNSVFEENDAYIQSNVLQERTIDTELPWDSIHLGVSKQYLKNEWKKAVKGETTEGCSVSCTHHCGACGKEANVQDSINIDEINRLTSDAKGEDSGIPAFPVQVTKHRKLLLSYKKTNKAAFLSHLDCMRSFERALLRAGYLSCYTKGFNPKPIIEFASPLALGLESKDEIVSIEIDNYDSIDNILIKINPVLPQGFKIVKAKELPPYIPGTKKVSLSSLYWGSDLFITNEKQIEKIIHIFAQLNDISDEQNGLHDFSPALDSFFMLGNGICIRWKKIEKKGYNIMNFLLKLTGQPYFESGLTITRMNTLAKGHNDEPDHYFIIL